MFKTRLIALLSLLLFIGSMTGVGLAHQPDAFPDLSEEDPYFGKIMELHRRDIIHGNEDGTLGGEDPLLRAGLVAVVARASNLSVLDTDKNCFPDVREEWFAGAICAMVRLGFMSGYPDGLFRPAREVTAGEAAKIKINALSEFMFVDLQEAIDFLESRGLTMTVLNRDDIINRKEAFARLLLISDAQLFQHDIEGNPFDPETDTLMVIEPGGPVFYANYNDTQFSRHIGKDPIILFFHASWCPRCRLSEEVILESLNELTGGAVIFKADFDTEFELRKTYGITLQDNFLAISSEGNVVGTSIGIRSADAIQLLIDEAVNN